MAAYTLFSQTDSSSDLVELWEGDSVRGATKFLDLLGREDRWPAGATAMLQDNLTVRSSEIWWFWDGTGWRNLVTQEMMES